MTPEGKVKVKIKRWYEENLPGHWRISPRGGPFGKGGAPDDIICWQGFFIAVEVKAIDGQLTPIQIKNLRDVMKAGGVAAVVKGYDEVRLGHVKAMVELKVRALQLGELILHDQKVSIEL